MKNKLFKKAFTLVEMLIVVIIIGILMGALLPKLKGAQQRARDTARKANLSQLSTALEMYFNDNGGYPTGNCASTDLKGKLTPTYIDSIPQDPQKGRTTYGTQPGGCDDGSYAYSELKKNGADEAGAVTIANVEAEGRVGNWVLSGDATTIKVELTGTKDEKYLTKKTCDVVNVTGASNATSVQCNETQREGWAPNNQMMVYVVFN